MRASVKAWFAEINLRIKASERNARDSFNLAKAQLKLANTLRIERDAAKKARLK